MVLTGLLFICALFVIAICVEFGTRLVFRNSMDYTLEMWKYARDLKRVSDDPLIGHEHIPNKSAHLMGVNISINSNGLRDREISYQKDSDTTRVLMLGDSVTMGWGVEAQMTASKQVMEARSARYWAVRSRKSVSSTVQGSPDR